MKKSTALKTLGLSEGASDEDIKKAHRKLIIENHPDKFGQDAAARAKAEEKTKLINEARDVLLNHSWDPEYASAGTAYGAPFPMTLLLLLTDKTLLEDVPQDMQQNHKGVQAIHGAPILQEVRLMDGPLEKRLFEPLGIPRDNSIPTLQALLQAGLVPRAALIRIPLQVLIPTLILLVPPTPVAQATILLAACSTCSSLKKKHLKTF